MLPLARLESIDWTLVPDILHLPIERWLAFGHEPYSRVLRAILCNDLSRALRFATEQERAMLPALVEFVSSQCPAQSHGSPDAYREWNRIGGLRGVILTTEQIGRIYG